LHEQRDIPKEGTKDESSGKNSKHLISSFISKLKSPKDEVRNWQEINPHNQGHFSSHNADILM